MADLPEIRLTTLDADGNPTLTPDATANAQILKLAFQQLSSRALYDGDPEAVLIDLLAYAYTLAQVSAVETAKQNILTYAEDVSLDRLAQPFGVTRLPAAKARTTIRFSAPDGLTRDRFVPTGTRVRSNDGAWLYVTLESGTVSAPIPDAHVDLVAEATVAGAAANGYAVGTVTRLVDIIPGVVASNVTTANGGADTESDSRLRERVPQALEAAAPSTRSGYSAIVQRIDQVIIDVGVFGPVDRLELGDDPRDGEVDLYILTESGLPSVELLDKVSDAIANDDKARIVGDFVNVVAPSGVDFSVNCELTVFPNVDPVATKSSVEAALQAVINDWASRLGADIVPSRLVATAMGVYGVVSVSIDTASRTLTRRERANCTGLSVEVVGESEE
ncbi:MAG: baseplate J/gp47 family protein [Cyanobacteria bacterium SBC]|nr:baseplate J/gp47 family protein [Cyanobacteria bacterium SBC]